MAVLVILGIGLIAYLVLQSIYRLYFHPLSHIPGPKLAAITHGYEFYHNIIRGGLFIWELERLHEVYGKLIEFLHLCCSPRLIANRPRCPHKPP